MSSRADIAEHLREIQRARTELAPLALADLLARVPGEAVRTCGIDRALLTLVRDDELVPASAGDAAEAKRLAEAPLEAEVAETRRPVLVGDAARPYVVAPLVHADRTLALLFAERRDGPPLDELDRELVWTFAATIAPLVHVATLAAVARTDARRLHPRRHGA